MDQPEDAGVLDVATRRRVRTLRLTGREIEVLCLVAQGFGNQEVADILFVAKKTVDFHLSNIYSKLAVNNRVRAVRAATTFGLIPFEPPVL